MRETVTMNRDTACRAAIIMICDWMMDDGGLSLHERRFTDSIG